MRYALWLLLPTGLAIARWRCTAVKTFAVNHNSFASHTFVGLYTHLKPRLTSHLSDFAIVMSVIAMLLTGTPASASDFIITDGSVVSKFGSPNIGYRLSSDGLFGFGATDGISPLNNFAYPGLRSFVLEAFGDQALWSWNGDAYRVGVFSGFFYPSSDHILVTTDFLDIPTGLTESTTFSLVAHLTGSVNLCIAPDDCVGHRLFGTGLATVRIDPGLIPDKYDVSGFSVTFATPEVSSGLMVLSGLIGLALWQWRREWLAS